MNKVLLIDSNYICHTARHAFGELEHNDKRTGVIFGMLDQILRLTTEFQTNDVIFFWDTGKSRRKRICNSYKSSRKSQKDDPNYPEDMEQFNLLRESILPRIGFNNHISADGYEADDLIYVYCETHQEQDKVVVSSDQDLYQVFQFPNVLIYRIGKKKKSYSEKDFRDEFGIDPVIWKIIKATAGCSSDDIKGAVGVGEKTAIKYYTKELTKGKKYDEIVRFIQTPEYRLNLRLVTLPFRDLKLPALKENNFSVNALKHVLCKYGMNSMLEAEVVERWEGMLNGVFLKSHQMDDFRNIKMLKRSKKSFKEQ